jgi:hypothetical protein
MIAHIVHCNREIYVQAESNFVVCRSCGSAERNVLVLMCIFFRHISMQCVLKKNEEGVSDA